MSLLGPPALGRGVVLRSAEQLPAQLRHLPVVNVDEAAIANPGPVVEQLHLKWLRREPVAIVLTVPFDVLAEPQVESREPHELDPGFEFARERLRFLVQANNYDARSGRPVWQWAVSGARLIRGAKIGGPADIETSRGPMWCDGGPRQPLSAEELDGHGYIHRDSIDRGQPKPNRFRLPSSELAPDQMAAVAHRVGPARIIAPAGSGKTRVLTERIRHLISDRLWEPELVLAAAYNQRAAVELRERTEGLGAHIRTLNALGLAICNGSGDFARPRNSVSRRVLHEGEVRGILKSLMPQQPFSKTDPFAPYLEGLRAIRLELMDPSEAEVKFEADGLARIFPAFVDRQKQMKAIDFDGQLYEASRILLTDPAARKQAQLVARHLLVDEFQDLTPGHLLLLRLMAAPTYDVFGVGDDDQVIYGFGGASPDYLIEYANYFPGAASYALEVNYRCPTAVVSAANSVLQNNEVRLPKEIRPAPGREEQPLELRVSASPSEGISDVLEAVRDWSTDGTAWKDMFVLSRVNAALLPVQVGLAEAGIPCRGPLTEAILERPGTRSALAYLRIANNPQKISGMDLTSVVRSSKHKISNRELEPIVAGGPVSLTRLFRDAASGSSALQDMVRDLETVRDLVKHGTVSDVLRHIRTDLALGSTLEEMDGKGKGPDKSGLVDEVLALEKVAVLHPDPRSFEPWLRKILQIPPDELGVELSTIHRTKGLEKERVIVYGTDEGMMPHRLSDDIPGERRLFHVAITRSKKSCLVLASREAPSMFVEEMGIGGLEQEAVAERSVMGRALDAVRGAGRRSGRAAAMDQGL